MSDVADQSVADQSVADQSVADQSVADQSAESSAWFLIVGLGNPGREYAANRHNVGFMCLDRLAGAHSLSFDRRQFKAQVAQGRMAGRRVILLKPQTYVNVSGAAVGAAARFYKIENDRILLIYDDLDLPQGTLRLRPEGGSGGHNGIKSIIQHLGAANFARIRVGIGRPPGRMEPQDYVLQNFDPAEREVMDEAIERAASAVEVFLGQGLREAMNRFNGQSK